jgi:hypothetical protein
VAYLKSLKALSEPQQLLVLLAEKPDRSAADNQLLAALVRLEQANDRAAQARLAAAKLIQSSKRRSAKAERKARAHRLIQQGVLFDLAGLESRSRGELLGLLLAAAKTEDPSAGRPGNRPVTRSWPKRAMRERSRKTFKPAG